MSTTYSNYYIWDNSNNPTNSTTNTGGSNIQFINIGTDPSFNTITSTTGRTGKRYNHPPNLTNGNWRVFLFNTDMSLNYLDLSWNFYIACDTSRNFFQGYPIYDSATGTYRDPTIHIYDISYNGRKYLGDVDSSGNPTVPKVYDASGGVTNSFSGINFLLDYWNNTNGGFTYGPAMYDPNEILPNSGGGGSGDGEGGGSDPSGNQGGGGGGQVDPSGGTDSSGNNVADNSQNIFIIDSSLNTWFFDPPKAATNGTMTLNTNLGGGIPGLQTSWTNPTQRRAAFDFVGNNPPAVDSSGVGIETVDDYNYLPYFQGLKVQLLLYDQTGQVLGTNQGWTDITFNTNTSYIGGGGGVSETWWENVDFLPRELEAINIFNSTVSAGVNTYNFNSNTFAYAIPGTFGGQPTAGAKVRIRVAMVNRAQVTIEDISYVEHNTTADVSWNWIYLPETGGLAIGDYGDPTPPLTITVPTGSDLQYNRFNISGANDNSGNDIQLSTANRNKSIVEKELGTRFTSLDKNNASLPKVQYRYDLSGSRASSSKQVGGSQAGVGGTNWIDISINIPDVADNSLNWFPSNANNPGSNWTSVWSNSLTSGSHPLVVFPEHNYKFTGYSMRYSLDPSRNTVDGYTDASLNSAWTSKALWTTLRPKRNQCTSTFANTLLNNSLSGTWSATAGTWPGPVSQYQITDGAYKAWETRSTIQASPSSLIFLNEDTVLQYTTTVNIPLRANGVVSSSGTETYVGIETANNEIIRMNSAVLKDGTTNANWFASWDLSGVQHGFTAPNIGTGATNPSNNFLEWETDAIGNAYELTNDISRNGGYYCGTRLRNIKLKNINLSDYQDVSNNTTPAQHGYQVIVFQELRPSSTGNWQRFPTSTNQGQNKVFNPALRPTKDITFEDSTATFVINDGYDGTGDYEQSGRTNNFKFGSNPSGIDPSANFFGLPLIYPSTDVISLSMTFSQFDPNWWPNDSNNALDKLRFYIKGGSDSLPADYHSTKPSGNYIQWGGTGKTVTKPWGAASNASGSFPDLPSSAGGGNDVSTLEWDFSLDNTGTASFTSNKYSRDLFDHNTYDMSANYKTANPFFYVDCQYDNNILRHYRGGASGRQDDLPRRTIGEAYSSAGDSSYKNRFEGKGVGPDGRYLLFWDNTLNTSVTFQKVGDTGTSPFNVYPFVANGTTNDYTTAYDHKNKLSNGTAASNGGDRQLIWAKNGFKPGGQTSTSNTNPYTDYSGNYWFGYHTSGFTQDYSNLNTIGEILDPSSVEYRSTSATSNAGKFDWWQNTTATSVSSFIWDSSMRFKFIVLKIPVLVGAFSNSYRGFTFEIETNSNSNTIGTNYDHNIALPLSDNSDLASGNLDTPVVWWQEMGNTNTHPSATTGFSGKTGWRAMHKCFNDGYSTTTNCENGAGSMDQGIYLATLSGSGVNRRVKIHKIYGNMDDNGGGGAFNLYFRIGLANGANYDIKKVKLQFYEINGTSYTKSTGTGNSKTFTFLA